MSSKEASNRLQDISNRMPLREAKTMMERGWSVYVMNMVRAPGNQFIFRKDNESGYQPFFGSSIKSQLKPSSLPEMQSDSFEQLCRRLIVGDLSERVKKLPDLTVRRFSTFYVHFITVLTRMIRNRSAASADSNYLRPQPLYHHCAHHCYRDNNY